MYHTMFEPLGVDNYIYGLVAGTNLTVFHIPLIMVTQLGSPYIWIIITMLILLLGNRDLKKFSGVLLIALMYSTVIVDDLKSLFLRTRPAGIIDNFFLFATGTAFPSGHAATSFLVAVVFGAFAGKKYAWIGYLLAVLVSLSRVLLGVHYLTDIIGGAILGLVMGWVVVYVANRLGFCCHGGAITIIPGVDAVSMFFEKAIKGKDNIIVGAVVAGLILLTVVSVMKQYVLTLAVIAVVSIVIVLLFAMMAVDRKNAILAAISLSAIGLTSSLSASLLGNYLLSLVIVLVTAIVLMLMPAVVSRATEAPQVTS